MLELQRRRRNHMLAEFIPLLPRGFPFFLCRDFLDLDAARAVRLRHRKSQRGYDFIYHLYAGTEYQNALRLLFGNGLLDLLADFLVQKQRHLDRADLGLRTFG